MPGLGVLTHTVTPAGPPAQRPQAEDVGILAAEVYFPSTYVRQEELERHDGVPSGKYTVGLGQQGVAFVGDREDPVSMGLTVMRRLLERHNVSPLEIGRLEAGTESSVDNSKSIKTYLMVLLEEAGNTDVEGVDCVQACYGGTAAVQNAVNWVESRGWDGRYAVVVMSDVSVYPAGPARPTSGAGAVALLIGPDAPLAFERGMSATHMAHAYDFYKPSGLYPAVDGPLSVYCYLQTLDLLYSRYTAKWERRNGRPFRLADADHALFHAPYNKLVQKAFARLMYHDITRHGEVPESLASCADCDLRDGSHPRQAAQMPGDLEKALVAHAFPAYDAKLIETTGAALEGRRVLLYSYGSGISATMLSLVGRPTTNPRFSLARLQAMSDLAMRLARRLPKSPADFEQAMRLAEQRWMAGNYKPEMPSLDDLEPGTFHLVEVDTRYRRIYARKPLA